MFQVLSCKDSKARLIPWEMSIKVISLSEKDVFNARHRTVESCNVNNVFLLYFARLSIIQVTWPYLFLWEIQAYSHRLSFRMPYKNKHLDEQIIYCYLTDHEAATWKAGLLTRKIRILGRLELGLSEMSSYLNMVLEPEDKWQTIDNNVCTQIGLDHVLPLKMSQSKLIDTE